MGTRRDARERAVQFLFQFDLNPPEDLEAALNAFWESHRASATDAAHDRATWGVPLEIPAPTTEETAVRLFAEPLIRGVLQHREDLDRRIAAHADNWDFKRIAIVDRNILRIAIFEMLHREDIPPVVSINEAVDVAKKFSTADSGRFVNGILDRIRADLPRPARIVK
jgi:transcription antitermination protein NusB